MVHLSITVSIFHEFMVIIFSKHLIRHISGLNKLVCTLINNVVLYLPITRQSVLRVHIIIYKEYWTPIALRINGGLFQYIFNIKPYALTQELG